MAGSYGHVTKNGRELRKPANALEMLDCHHGDVFEAIEEMYGMIWYLASELSLEVSSENTTERLVKEAQLNYKAGLKRSPTKRYKSLEIGKLQQLVDYGGKEVPTNE